MYQNPTYANFPSTEHLVIQPYYLDNNTNAPAVPEITMFPHITRYLPMLAVAVAQDVMNRATNTKMRTFMYNLVVPNGFRTDAFVRLMELAVKQMAVMISQDQQYQIYEDAIVPAAEKATGLFITYLYHTVPDLPNYVRLEDNERKMMALAKQQLDQLESTSYKLLNQGNSMISSHQNHAPFHQAPQPVGYPQHQHQQPAQYAQPPMMQTQYAQPPMMQQPTQYAQPPMMQPMAQQQLYQSMPVQMQPHPHVQQPMVQPMHQQQHQQQLHQQMQNNGVVQHHNYMQHDPMSNARNNPMLQRRMEKASKQSIESQATFTNQHATQQSGVMESWSIAPSEQVPEPLRMNAQSRQPAPVVRAQPNTPTPLFTTDLGVRYYDVKSGIEWKPTEYQVHRPTWNLRTERLVIGVYPDGKVLMEVMKLTKEEIMNYDAHKTTSVLRHENMLKLQAAMLVPATAPIETVHGEGDDRFTTVEIPEHAHIEEDVDLIMGGLETFITEHKIGLTRLQIDTDAEPTIFTTKGGMLEVHSNLGPNGFKYFETIAGTRSFNGAHAELKRLTDTLPLDDIAGHRALSIINRRLTTKVNEILQYKLGLDTLSIDDFLTDHKDLIDYVRETFGPGILKGFLEFESDSVLDCLCTGTEEHQIQALEDLGLDCDTALAMTGTTAKDLLASKGLAITINSLYVSTMNCDLQDLELGLDESGIGGLREQTNPLLFGLAKKLLDETNRPGKSELSTCVIRTLDGAEFYVFLGRLNREHIVIVRK